MRRTVVPRTIFVPSKDMESYEHAGWLPVMPWSTSAGIFAVMVWTLPSGVWS